MRIWLLFLSLLLSGIAIADPVYFEIFDSTEVEDTYIRSNAATTNFGRVGTATRVDVSICPIFTNTATGLLRFLSFPDSVANHTDFVIDSLRVRLTIKYLGLTSTQVVSYKASGLEKDWEEGNKNGAAAADCEVCWDSARTVGAGTCADNLDWGADGAGGTADTLGVWTGAKPQDSLILDTSFALNEQVYIWIDTQAANYWLDVNNYGMIAYYSYKSATISPSTTFYGSESNMTGFVDSIPRLQVWGHTAAAPPASNFPPSLVHGPAKANVRHSAEGRTETHGP